MGLPHTAKFGKIMSPNYGAMKRFYEDEYPQETLPRLYAKYGKRKMISRWAKRWELWKRRRLDNY
jgi:hypothetical protein